MCEVYISAYHQYFERVRVTFHYVAILSFFGFILLLYLVTIIMLWLGLAQINNWLGLEKDHVLAFKCNM